MTLGKVGDMIDDASVICYHIWAIKIQVAIYQKLGYFASFFNVLRCMLYLCSA